MTSTESDGSTESPNEVRTSSQREAKPLSFADGWFYGSDCAIKFLEVMNHNSLIFFLNLAYDINFIISHLDKVFDNSIIRNGRVMRMIGAIRVRS